MTATQMQSLGIAQYGDPVLTATAARFSLPAQASFAHRVIRQLLITLDQVSQVHDFTKGMGIAAPQIHLGYAAAVIRPPGGEAITLLNPRISGQSSETDAQYEGCLSFFDTRGLVRRPLAVEVTHQDAAGDWRVLVLERGLARLACHEVDHLQGVLYRDRMRPGVSPVPSGSHPGAGRPWAYIQEES